MSANRPRPATFDQSPAPQVSSAAPDVRVQADEGSFPDARDFPLLQLAWEAFQRDLPQLTRDHLDEFVAYQGDVCLGINPSPWPLEELCGSLPRGTSEVFCIRPPEDDDRDATPSFS